MNLSILRRLALPVVCLALAVAPAVPSGAQTDTEPAKDSVTETIQVTATRVPEDVEAVPASVTVVSGDELRARGVNDLAGALAVVAGVSVAPGGDGGPAGSVPEIWGLREFDAFLLVVDEVPRGGAFNPALTAIDLNGVERIEILRGAAPVLYGATSFVGVIHVIHRAAGSAGRTASLWGGNYSSGGASVSLPLSSGTFQQSLSLSAETQGFKDDRTGFERGHLLWRGARATANGRFHVDFDANALRQDPASPHVRQGRVLTPLTPIDANHNPRGAKIDEDRWHLTAGYDRTLGALENGTWSTTVAFTHTRRDTLRGFLGTLSNTAATNATGFDQDLSLNDVYLDTHVAFQPAPTVQVVAGFDHLYGKAEAESRDFNYFVRLDGSGAPAGSAPVRRTRFEMEDERSFSGLYLQTEWTPVPRLRLQVGARLNRTQEDREGGEASLLGGSAEEEDGKVENTITRGSGMVGASWLAWEANDGGIWLYADWRNSFKPAALDFGPEAEPEILDAETADSWEVGLKGRHLAGRVEWELSAFQMDFDNLVVAQVVNGLPALVNAGAERFKGYELETEVRLREDLLARAVYSYHDARFQDYVQAFDGVPTQLDGKRLEMSAQDMGGLELVWFPEHGFNGSVQASYVGDRFLNKRNTALAPSYTTYAAGLGYRFTSWDLRLQGDNLTDERDPVAESELGDAQYYRLPARSYRLIWSVRF